MLEKRTFKELLVDMELRNLQNNIVGQEASRLFARAEINMGPYLHLHQDLVVFPVFLPQSYYQAVAQSRVVGLAFHLPPFQYESIKKNIWIVYGNALFGIDCRLFG